MKKNHSDIEGSVETNQMLRDKRAVLCPETSCATIGLLPSRKLLVGENVSFDLMKITRIYRKL